MKILSPLHNLDISHHYLTPLSQCNWTFFVLGKFHKFVTFASLQSLNKIIDISKENQIEYMWHNNIYEYGNKVNI